MKRGGLLGVMLAACLLGCYSGLRAQDRAMQYEKSKLWLDDLLRLQKSKDIGYIDDYLGKKGWELESTSMDTSIVMDVSIVKEQCVVWAFARRSGWSGVYAYGWFKSCLYTDFCSDTLHEITYGFVDNTQLNEIRADLKRKGYEPVASTEVVEKGLVSIYRKGEYEVELKKKRNKAEDKGADITYVLHISNYRKSEDCIAEWERLNREEKEKARRYQEVVQQADILYSLKRYDEARTSYLEAVSIMPEDEEIYVDRLLELDIEILCEEANSLLANELYDEAKEKYIEALRVKSNYKNDFIKNEIINILCKEADAFLTKKMYDEAKKKYLDALQLQSDYKKDFIQDEISRIEVMQKFLSERAYSQYDYKAFETEDYDAKNKYIQKQLKDALMAINENVPEMRIEVVGEVDTLGNSVFNYNMSVENDWLSELLGTVCRNLKLKKVEFNGYSANAVAEFVYTIAHECQVVNLKNSVKGCNISDISNSDQQMAIQKQMKTAPYGKYTFDLKSTAINGKSYKNNKLQKMRCAGGPENALLSLIVPGLGMHKVTYGKRIGLGTTLPTYALLGGGVGLKIYSNKEYKKYHDATTQSEMDKHYTNANLANYGFYGCMLVGGLIWISDIIRVAVIGSQNLKKFNAYKHSYLGYYYNPEIEAMGVSYTIKF